MFIKKLLIYFIIFLDLLFLAQLSYKKYMDAEAVDESYYPNSPGDISKSIEETENDVIMSFYGDTVLDHRLVDFNGMDVLIANNRESNYKLISIIGTNNKDIINTSTFLYFTSLQGKLDSLGINTIDYFYLLEGSYIKEYYNILAKLKGNFNINFFFVDQNLLIDLYKIPDCKCGFIVLLDKNNIIRLINYKLPISVISEIIEREIQK